MTPLLSITDLSFTHVGRSQPTINQIHLTLQMGEIVLIAGATGSGKSTLLNCIAGISPLHTGGKLTGEIQSNGESILNGSVQQRSRILGIVLQNVETQLFTDQVTEELAFGLENLNLPPAQIGLLTNAALQEFGLESQRNWAITQLSAGQKQRLILACVLAMNQPILLLDEPFAYLDRAGAELLLRLLKHRAAQGQSILLVEHRLDLVKDVCDRVFQFEAGHLVEGSRAWASVNVSRTGVESEEAIKHSLSDSHILQTQNVSWGGYPAFPDLEMNQGETVLLKGDNGCGKTTFLKLVCGLLKPSTGKIQLFGRNTRKQRVVRLAKAVGFVLQNPNHQLFGDSVQQEVLQPGVTASAAAQMLEQLRLSDRVEHHPQTLSQGQKRRLALGAVLVRQPQLCLLDEITVGQDPQSLSLMLEVLRNFTQQGGTLILTSHDPQVANCLNARVIQIGSRG
ncbi:MAG: energy-coupling factor ABC transporter ATP-binding protein [Leptolyngbyaceae cyanobacterium CAN_BIN12]|nr:energy-coupling factor ABC transporter ATP-binding protein [Leptolyngbyaceae cyanobacterium CAN_BIN12]